MDCPKVMRKYTDRIAIMRYVALCSHRFSGSVAVKERCQCHTFRKANIAPVVSNTQDDPRVAKKIRVEKVSTVIVPTLPTNLARENPVTASHTDFNLEFIMYSSTCIIQVILQKCTKKVWQFRKYVIKAATLEPGGKAPIK
jgi:hypothetical protein